MVDYNNFAKTFSQSRKNMKWAEIEYFLENIGDLENKRVLDIGCGSGRLLETLKKSGIKEAYYLGVDLSRGLLEEARKNYKGYNFLELNMIDLDTIEEKFDVIFFIASFHHLKNEQDRKEVLEKTKQLLNSNGKVFMTNWALNSELNLEKYKNSIIEGSENEFGGCDYTIKIGDFTRYYHCFSLEELDYLFQDNRFKILENRLFDNKRNFISIIEKTED